MIVSEVGNGERDRLTYTDFQRHLDGLGRKLAHGGYLKILARVEERDRGFRVARLGALYALEFNHGAVLYPERHFADIIFGEKPNIDIAALSGQINGRCHELAKHIIVDPILYDPDRVEVKPYDGTIKICDGLVFKLKPVAVVPTDFESFGEVISNQVIANESRVLISEYMTKTRMNRFEKL